LKGSAGSVQVGATPVPSQRPALQAVKLGQSQSSSQVQPTAPVVDAWQALVK
jgi:hypothetical protein